MTRRFRQAKKEAEKKNKSFIKIQKKADKIATKENQKLEADRRRMSLTPLEAQQPQQHEGNPMDRRPSLVAGLALRRDSKLLPSSGPRCVHCTVLYTAHKPWLPVHAVVFDLTFTDVFEVLNFLGWGIFNID